MTLHVHWSRIEKDLKEGLALRRDLTFVTDTVRNRRYKSTWELALACACGTLQAIRVHTIWKNGAVIAYHTDAERLTCSRCSGTRTLSQLGYAGLSGHVHTADITDD